MGVQTELYFNEAKPFENQPERALLLTFLKSFISRKETVKMYDKIFTSDLHITNTLESDPQTFCLQKRMNESRNMFSTIVRTSIVLLKELNVFVKSTF